MQSGRKHLRVLPLFACGLHARRSLRELRAENGGRGDHVPLEPRPPVRRERFGEDVLEGAAVTVGSPPAGERRSLIPCAQSDM